jgi:signal transduction histidine kinase
LLQNLINNALKFRGEGRPPTVRVEVRRQEGDWLFTVSDNGIGIEPQYLANVFYLGAEARLNKKIPGSGLGLATCAKIVQRHNGRIWAESAGPDRGTTIAFTLPVCPKTSDQPAVTPPEAVSQP